METGHLGQYLGRRPFILGIAVAVEECHGDRSDTIVDQPLGELFDRRSINGPFNHAIGQNSLVDLEAAIPGDQERPRLGPERINVVPHVTADLQNITEPAVVSNAPFGSFRSSTAFVAMVDPCRIIPISDSANP